MGNLMSKAMTQLLIRHAWFATLALNLTLIKSDKTETMATDGKAIYYNPTWVATLALIEIISVIAHEVLHVAFCHHLRRNGRDADLWNQACDYAINWIIVDSKVFRLPEGGLYDERFRDKTAEQIYNILLSEQTPEDQPEDQPEDSQSPGDEADDAAPAKPLIGEVWDATNEDGEPLNAAEQAAEELKAGANVSAAFDAEKTVGIGESDAALRNALEVNKVDEIPWYEQLAQWTTQYVIGRSSFNTPNRRLLHTGHILPSYTKEVDFKLVFAWDTSGSLTDELTGLIKTHINNVVQVLNPSNVKIIYCDTRVRGSQTFARCIGSGPWAMDIELEDIKPLGGGGTQFDPVFQYIEDEDISADCLVYFTDGHGSVNAEEPDYPVLWATTDKTPNFSSEKFGETITIK